MSRAFELLSNEVLSLIEIQETQLLNWGFVSGRLDLRSLLPDLLNRLPEQAQEMRAEFEQQGTPVTADAILQNLADRRLLFRLEDNRYRSRFAETVRLLYLLRQRFSEKDWATAPRLVGDMRLQLQRRQYPRRDIPWSKLHSDLQALSTTPLQVAVIDHLLQQPDGEHLHLARFQHEAILHQLGNLGTNKLSALVIGAGTGAGKTKSFYLPALAHIAEHLVPNQPYLQALAIYPRVELLKDQLNEAFAETRKLDGLLRNQDKRPISIGAYYGDTPESAAQFLGRYPPSSWRKVEMGYLCPYLSCPNGSNHQLVWETGNIQAEEKANKRGQYGRYTRLRCQTCDFETTEGQLLLTRSQMRRQPPDILFTSTEMLNRRLSHAGEHALFGIGQPRPPRLVLLDEIHTYEGITGSQVAYLLRRWRYARGNPPGHALCVVGLSATLTQAIDFFAKLTGVPIQQVDYISPEADDLVDVGIEYNLVLKGDPVSGANLLSTSVQTLMLMGRVLDPVGKPLSGGAYGQRIFAFTDKLDVINRWYQIMYDAEWNKTLSQFRESNERGLLEQRREQGQVWDICELLGYDLNIPLNLSRTTSQDPGVNSRSDVIIATSTLEVGYNDVTVGAVVQHKAPRGMASFLQRKGRAGRIRAMRPWTVVVTSAYGRDRWAFQHAETLFNPQLPPLNLPIENYYVRKIQAAYALMDWLASKLKSSDPQINIWQALSTGNRSERSTQLGQTRQRVHRLLLEVLRGNRRTEFERYLEQVLGLKPNSAEINSILWGEPRALYLEVIPTLLRQLETNWRRVRDNGQEEMWADNTAAQPLPDFVPPALFADLNLPELRLQLPPLPKRSAKETQSEDQEPMLPLNQAMGEFAPGRASKRFILDYKEDIAHWLPLPDEAQLTRGRLNLKLLGVESDFLSSLTVQDQEYKLYRPRYYQLNNLPANVRSVSGAELIWWSHFAPRQSSTVSRSVANVIALPPLSNWLCFFKRIQVYTHANDNWVDTTRLAVGVRTDTRYRDGRIQQHTLYFEDADGNAALGFTVAADALQFNLEPLVVETVRALPEWPQLYHHFGPEFFRHRLRHDPRLEETNLSVFTIDWLWQLELSMLVAVAIAKRISLAEAAVEVSRNRPTLAQRTLDVIFQSQRAEDDDEEARGPLYQRLLDYMADESVTAALREQATVLWNDNHPGLSAWLESCYAASVGSVLLTAISRFIPDIDPDELTMDVDGCTIWITENTGGGVGLISRIADAIAQRPRHFELQMLDIVQYCEREQLALNLRAVVNLLATGDKDLASAFQLVRTTTDLSTLLATRQTLAAVLEKAGVAATRPLFVALNAKFLRPNSDSDSDSLLVSLVENWEQEESRLGTAVDLRVMAVAARQIPAIEQQVQQLLKRIGGAEYAPDDSQIFNLLQSLLWLNCHNSCPECIEKWQPYQQLPPPSRALLQLLLNPNAQAIPFGSPYWETRAREMLADEHQAQISCQPDEMVECKEALRHFLTTPVEVGYQQFHPVVERLLRQEGVWIVQLAIQEMVGW